MHDAYADMRRSAVSTLPAVAMTRSVKRSEHVAAAIVNHIVERDLPAGTKLPNESVMLELYEVSRGSLREALRILEVNGLVIMKPGPSGGPVVGEASAADFSRSLSLFLQMGRSTFGQVLDARVTVEPMFARLAAESVDGSGRQALEAALWAHEHLDPRDVSAYLNLAQEFHALIARLSGNGVLSLFGEALTEVFANRSLATHQPPTRWGEVKSEHEVVAQAILAGDGELAENEMRAHMKKFACSFRQRHDFLIDDVVGWH